MHLLLQFLVQTVVDANNWVPGHTLISVMLTSQKLNRFLAMQGNIFPPQAPRQGGWVHTQPPPPRSQKVLPDGIIKDLK